MFEYGTTYSGILYIDADGKPQLVAKESVKSSHLEILLSYKINSNSVREAPIILPYHVEEPFEIHLLRFGQSTLSLCNPPLPNYTHGKMDETAEYLREKYPQCEVILHREP